MAISSWPMTTEGSRSLVSNSSLQPLDFALRRAAAAPWKVGLEARRLLMAPAYISYLKITGVEFPTSPKLYGRPLVRRQRGSRIFIGNDVTMRSWFASNPLGVRNRCILATWSEDAVIEVGNNVKMSGTTLVAWTHVKIGDNVRLGANTMIVDADFHPLDPVARRSDPRRSTTRPTIIENDAFIGTGAMVLKGVTIGSGAVIGAGSVVAQDVAPGSVVAGNPAMELSRR